MRMAYYSKRNVTDKFNIFIIIINNEKSSLKNLRKSLTTLFSYQALAKRKMITYNYKFFVKPFPTF